MVIPDLCLELDEANPKKEIPDWDSVIVEPLELQEEKAETQKIQRSKTWSPTEEKKYSTEKNEKFGSFFICIFSGFSICNYKQGLFFQ